MVNPDLMIHQQYRRDGIFFTHTHMLL